MLAISLRFIVFKEQFTKAYRHDVEAKHPVIVEVTDIMEMLGLFSCAGV